MTKNNDLIYVNLIEKSPLHDMLVYFYQTKYSELKNYYKAPLRELSIVTKESLNRIEDLTKYQELKIDAESNFETKKEKAKKLIFYLDAKKRIEKTYYYIRLKEMNQNESN